MESTQSFADFAAHYAQLTASDAYEGAFAETRPTAQLSAFDEPSQAPMPEPALAEFFVASMTASAFELLADTRLEAYANRIAWGIVNSFHMVAAQVERAEDDAAKKLGELARHSDPSEIFACEVEEAQRICQSLMEARAALECMRDHGAQVYHAQTGRPWSATRGSRVSSVTSASQIDAKDFLASRAKARREQLNPTGPIVVISGGSAWEDHRPIYERLDLIKRRVPSMTLATTAQSKGVDAIAAAWAASHGVPVIAFRLNRSLGASAGFKRNKLLVSLAPVEVIVCEGSGIQINLADECRKGEIPVTIIRKSDCRDSEITVQRRAV